MIPHPDEVQRIIKDINKKSMLENLRNPCEGCHDSYRYDCSLRGDTKGSRCIAWELYQAQCSILREVVDWLRKESFNYSESTQYQIQVAMVAKKLEQLLKEKGIEGGKEGALD